MFLPSLSQNGFLHSYNFSKKKNLWGYDVSQDFAPWQCSFCFNRQFNQVSDGYKTEAPNWGVTHTFSAPLIHQT
jgi:hypothetical protein